MGHGCEASKVTEWIRTPACQKGEFGEGFADEKKNLEEICLKRMDLEDLTQRESRN